MSDFDKALDDAIKFGRGYMINNKYVTLEGVEKRMSALKTQEGGSHYKNCAIQPIEYCQKNKLNALESFVVKYVTRHKAKNGLEDIKKAIHCLELLIELEYGEPWE